MATVKVKFRASSIQGCEGTVYYQVIHERRVRQLSTDYKILSTEWNDSRGTVVVQRGSSRMGLQLSVRERIRWDMDRFSKIIRRLNQGVNDYTTDDVVEEFERYSNECTLFNFMENIIVKLKHGGKVRTSETYMSTLNNFRRFLVESCEPSMMCNGDDIMLDRIDTTLMEEYQAWQVCRDIKPNTISFYMRILRAVYNRAVDCELIESRNPFRHVYTGVDKTVKRALSLELMKRIIKLDLSKDAGVAFARDMFILSFSMRGMSFVDMAYLKKTDLANSRVTYRRRKTGQMLIIQWTNEMKEILARHPANPSEYLLPIIMNPRGNERSTYRNMSYNINRNLKKVGKMLGLEMPLTLYVARHSWASAAKAKGIPLSVISEGMGHDSETTTQIYLASLDTSAVDKANAIILDALK